MNEWRLGAVESRFADSGMVTVDYTGTSCISG